MGVTGRPDSESRSGRSRTPGWTACFWPTIFHQPWQVSPRAISAAIPSSSSRWPAPCRTAHVGHERRQHRTGTPRAGSPIVYRAGYAVRRRAGPCWNWCRLEPRGVRCAWHGVPAPGPAHGPPRGRGAAGSSALRRRLCRARRRVRHRARAVAWPTALLRLASCSVVAPIVSSRSRDDMPTCSISTARPAVSSSAALIPPEDLARRFTTTVDDLEESVRRVQESARAAGRHRMPWSSLSSSTRSASALRAR